MTMISGAALRSVSRSRAFPSPNSALCRSDTCAIRKPSKSAGMPSSFTVTRLIISAVLPHISHAANSAKSAAVMSRAARRPFRAVSPSFMRPAIPTSFRAGAARPDIPYQLYIAAGRNIAESGIRPARYKTAASFEEAAQLCLTMFSADGRVFAALVADGQTEAVVLGVGEAPEV